MKSKTLVVGGRAFQMLERPFLVFCISFVVYFGLSSLAGYPFRVRESAYFNFLADAFLHGQYFLRYIPETVHDLSFFNGHYYLYWPPMPAIVLMPFIALFGVQFSDVFFSVIVASLNIAVFARLLRSVDQAGIIPIRSQYRGMLILFFAFGTSYVTIAFLGQVWYTAQLLGLLFVGLAYLAAIELTGVTSFLITGILIGCAMLTRNHLLFTGLWPAYYLISKNWNDRPRLFQYIVIGFVPPLLMGLWFLSYNYTRFGSIYELGLRYHKMAPNFIMDYQKYGAFHLHYVPTNLFYQYVHYPFPFDNNTYMGSSLFLLSPVFFYAFGAIRRGYRNPQIRMLVVSVLATSIPILLLMGTGWVQYGPRYTLDFTLPLLLLTAYGVQDTSPKLIFWLVVISVLQYIPGIYLYIRLGL